MAALKRLKTWTRERFSLGDEVIVFVAELACGLHGCPPRETVIAFWSAPERRHQFKLFKSVCDITAEDLPPYWMKDAIITDGVDDSCC